MKMRLLMFACAAGLLAVPAAKAAPGPSGTKNSAGPAITLQAKSLEELLDLVKTTAKSFLPKDAYKDFEKETMTKLDLSALKGVDLKKPLGLYANLDASLKDGDFSKTTLVLLIPIADEKEFVGFLEQTGIKLEKNGEVYSIQAPLPFDISLRFRKGYAYIGTSGEKLDVKGLLDPGDVISPTEKAALALHLRLDRIPDELKEKGNEFFEQSAGLISLVPVPPEAKGIVDDVVKMALFVKLGLSDGKELVYRFDVEPKAGTIRSEYTVEPKPGSVLAKSIAGIKPTKNDFAGIVGDDSVAHLLFETPLFVDEVQSMLMKLVDLGEKKADASLQGAPKGAVDLAEETFKTLKRTVSNRDLDIAASLRGPDKNELYTVIGAVSLKDTAALEKSIKSAVTILPKDAADKIKIDAFKVEGVNVHELVTSDKVSPDAQKVFGKSNVFVALASDALFITFGPRAKELITDALSAKQGPKPAPLLQAEFSGKKLMTLWKNAGAPMDGPGAEFIEKLSKFERLPVFSGKLEGGAKLVWREELGLAPIMMFGRVSERKAAPLPVPVPKAAPPKK